MPRAKSQALQSTLLSATPTCELQWELERREGITTYKLGPEPRFSIIVDGAIVHDGKGPCTLTVNID